MVKKEEFVDPVRWATGLAIFARVAHSKRIYIPLVPKKSQESKNG